MEEVGKKRLEMMARDRFRREKNAQPICLLLGAGADIGSGGLTFTQFKRQCYSLINDRSPFEVTSGSEIDSFFQEVFGRHIPFQERVRFVEAIFRGFRDALPSDSYQILALLTKFCGIDAIITTNFDVMLETAANSLGGRHFDVFAPGLALPDNQGKDIKRVADRCPYIKIHGDLSAGIITKLTTDELNSSDYEPSLLCLLETVIRTHVLVISGYSGYDTALAAIIGRAACAGISPIFWCQPRPPFSDSPLLAELPPERLTHVSVTFEECVELISKPVLERPVPLPQQQGYIPSLVEWRASFTNSEFIREYGYMLNRDYTRTFVRRDSVEQEIKRFISDRHNLAVIVGPSGFGKTTIGLRLHREFWDPSRQSWIVLLKSKNLNASNFEDSISDWLGLGISDYGSLYSFERRLNAEGRSLLLFIDAINEYGPELSDSLRLFRGILRLSYILPESSRIKIIVTIRHETWSALLGAIDRNQLASVLYPSGSKSDSPMISPIPIDRFDADELRTAINELNRQKIISFSYDELLPQQKERLRDPFLLRSVLESKETNLKNIAGPNLYRDYFEKKLERIGTAVGTAQVIDTLSELAALCFSRRSDVIRPLDVHNASHVGGDMTRLLKDVGIFVEVEDGLLRFGHERAQQYFLFLAIGRSSNAPTIDNLQDLKLLLSNAAGDNRIVAAARLYLYTKKDKFNIVEQAMETPLNDASPSEDISLFVFCKEVILEAAKESPAFLSQYAKSVVRSSANHGSVSSHHLKTVIQASALLKPGLGIPILVEALNSRNDVARAEASIYLNDKFTALFLQTREPLNLLESENFGEYFNDSSVSTWRRVMRLISFSASIGPDNTHPDEYDRFSEALRSALLTLWPQLHLSYKDIGEILDEIRISKDRYFFNSLDSDLERFFRDDGRGILINWLNRMEEDGYEFHLEDLTQIKPYMRSTSHHTIFVLNNILVSLAAEQNFKSFIDVWKLWVGQLGDDPEPEEVDFFTSIICYAYIINNETYDDILYDLTENVLFNMPHVITYSPGVSRGFQRGYKNSFDMKFEDGFNPISSYLFMAPSNQRKGMHFSNYNRNVTFETVDIQHTGSLFSEAMNKYFDNDEISRAIRVLHAIGQTVSLWPAVGLAYLKRVAGIQDRTFRRALVRLLCETYARQPMETQRFLESAQGSFTPDEMQTIRVAIDNHLGRRQFETVEWARIVHFILKKIPNGRKKITQVLRIIFRSDTLKDAVENTVSALNIYQPGLK